MTPSTDDFHLQSLNESNMTPEQREELHHEWMDELWWELLPAPRGRPATRAQTQQKFAWAMRSVRKTGTSSRTQQVQEASRKLGITLRYGWKLAAQVGELPPDDPLDDELASLLD
jgi:hypothetical protein